MQELDAHRLAELCGREYEEDPMAFFERLRAEHGALAPVIVPGGLEAWLVLGHRENLEVVRTPSLFSRDSREWSAMQEGKVPADHPLAPLTTWQPLCVFTDGERHKRLRKAVTDSLAQFEARGIRRHVVRFARQLIDEFAEDGQADLIKQFAEQLPLRVITQLFGMSEDYGPRLVEAAKDMISASPTAAASNDFVTRVLEELVERKRAEPGHDVASKLLEHPANLTDDEVREHLRLKLVASHEPTVDLLGKTLRLILTDRRFRATLAGGHMTLPDALEQVLWDAPPMITNIGRWATGDAELSGKLIKRGDMLLLGLAAGNVDPAIRPDLSVSMQGNRSHLAFSGGPHECPGQDLGRAIVDTGIDVLLTELVGLELAVPAEELRCNATLLQNRLVALPVVFPRKKPLPSAAARTVPAELPMAQPTPKAAPVPAAPDPEPVHLSPWGRLVRWFQRQSPS